MSANVSDHAFRVTGLLLEGDDYLFTEPTSASRRECAPPAPQSLATMFPVRTRPKNIDGLCDPRGRRRIRTWEDASLELLEQTLARVRYCRSSRYRVSQINDVLCGLSINVGITLLDSG